MTLCYVHQPPGFKPPPRHERLRSWDDSSPYHKNRPLRGPRGGDVLRLLRKPITFNNIPKLERITVHSYVKHALYDGSAYLHVAGMAIQAITNVRAETFKSKASVPNWGVSPGKRFVAVKSELYGEDMYHFFGKLVDVVMPRIKDWRGVKGSSGDSSGNLSFGLQPEVVGLFPEIEVNYDMYVLSSPFLSNSPSQTKRNKATFVVLTIFFQVPTKNDSRMPHHDPHHRPSR